MIKYIKSLFSKNKSNSKLKSLKLQSNNPVDDIWTTVAVILPRDTYINIMFKHIKSFKSTKEKLNAAFKYHLIYSNLAHVEIRLIGNSSLCVKKSLGLGSSEQFISEQFQPLNNDEFDEKLSILITNYVNLFFPLFKRNDKFLKLLNFIDNFTDRNLQSMFVLTKVRNINLVENKDSDDPMERPEIVDKINFIYNEILKDNSFKLNDELLPKEIVIELHSAADDESYNKLLKTTCDLTTIYKLNNSFIEPAYIINKIILVQFETLIARHFKAIYQKTLLYSTDSFTFELTEDFLKLLQDNIKNYTYET